MDVESRSRVVLVVLSIACRPMTLGCGRNRDKTPSLAAPAIASYEGLRPELTWLQGTLSSVHKAFDEVPEGVPGASEVRLKLFQAEEVLGVVDARVTWLSGELETAKKSGSKEQIARVTDEIAATAGDMRQVRDVSVELAHQTARLRRYSADSKP
jgi:hypothetical protein